jgi:hypothetical protein
METLRDESRWNEIWSRHDAVLEWLRRASRKLRSEEYYTALDQAHVA